MNDWRKDDCTGAGKCIIAFLGIFLGVMFGGCQKPTTSDVVGTWVNTDGATLELEGNGKFSAYGLPADVFMMHDSNDAPIRGKGRWKLEYENPDWTVKLEFDDLSGFPLRAEIPVLVSGAGKSVGLYHWKGEEGGARYELTKK